MDGSTLDIYLDRARSYELSTKQYDELAELLRTTDNDRVRFKCILALRREGSHSRIQLVAPWVHSADSGVSEEAMRFVIRDLGRGDLVQNLLLQWLADDAEFGYKQLAAIQLAGEAYRTTKDEVILREIVRLLDHPRETISDSASDSLFAALMPGYEAMTPFRREQLRRTAKISDFRRQAEELLSVSPFADRSSRVGFV